MIALAITTVWVLCGAVVWRPTFRRVVEGLRIGSLTMGDVLLATVMTTFFCALGGPITLGVHLLQVGVDENPESFARMLGGESRQQKVRRLEGRIRDLERETGVAR